ncbi:hypothetical protein [Providencia vermicola]|uniref:hypothetical protein n=1 Tax=Providencia vermicola TaxID=333965 RepID=UPI003D276010
MRNKHDNQDYMMKFLKIQSDVFVPYLREIIHPAELKSVFCVYEMIEQGENIYTYLVNGDTVVIFEMSRIDQSIIHDRTIPIREYAQESKGRQWHRYVRELQSFAEREDSQVK